ncbi:hypothetical protein [Paractinoplanes atraurantiacus]|uniref:Excreted virulence factor EspC, type VII ESX diderm n=1 Tax=Paractinoplanes atraurantiacus TaxID=1036182 RepID=A0A285K4I1_9ACTN|nr:hypothetical protein [Actinoplanes atraurantiacus]SNY67499.1 hypothetical protein SAMN05421748_131128 [Actinoplanes atraurantiacus]
MAEFYADLPALDAYSDRTVGRRDQIEQVRNQLEAVRVPRDAFGYIPGIGGRIHDAYDGFVDSCVDAADQITDAVYSLSQAVRLASEAYAESDQGAVVRMDTTGALHQGVQ